MLIPRAMRLVVLFAVAACGSTQLTTGQQANDPPLEPRTQAAQAQIRDFDGKWVGSGSNARNSFRLRCGNGPLVDLTIQNGAAKAVLKFFVRRTLDNDVQSHVIPLNGTIDDHGRMELSGYQASASAVLSAESGSGDGTWETRELVCNGRFQVNHRP
ncbi:MAG: hypothetical protein ACR2PO_10520 [Methyloligellaceae bacterium]